MGYGIHDIFDPYSERIIREYVKKLNEDIREQDTGGESEHRDAGEKPWMRNNPLEGGLYSCIINGRPVSLQEIFFGSKSMETRQNIIVIAGEKHIGKKYFAKELLKVCQESIQKDRHHLFWGGTSAAWRIPVVLKYKRHWRSGGKLSLSELITEAIREKCVEVDKTKVRSQLKKKVEKLLNLGRFLIYFEGKSWLRELEDELKSALNYGKIVEDYNKNAKYRNLVIITVDSDTDMKESFLDEQFYAVIFLKKLSEDEVREYLLKYLPGLLPLVEKEAKIMEILRYPEHLKMFEALYDKRLIEDGSHNELKNDFDFYDYFLRANIRKKLAETSKGKDKGTGGKPIVNRPRENAILNKLRGYAIGLYLENKKEKEDPSRYFSFDDYMETGILDKDGEFVFPLCGYYLVAQDIVERVAENALGIIPQCLLEEPLETVLIWAGRMIDDIECFSRFWNCLEGNKSCKLLLLAKIVKVAEFKDVFEEKIYKKAFSNLKEDFYDYSVLEMLEELGYDGVDHLKHKYLMLAEEYDVISQNNIKKRLVYFLGISHNGIIGKMLDELMEEKTDLHLKYHIIRAAVENYGKHKESTELVMERFEQLEDYCGRSEDAIIRSDFCILYEKHKNREWIYPENMQKLMGELEAKMEDRIYWIRAHAAGAIGRRNKAKSYNLLTNRIERELQLIYDKKGDYRNSIKVISYSVEAVCELSEHREGEKAEVICHLAGLLEMELLGDQDIEDAYSTIATGIEYMINPDAEKLPFNLGGRFRNHTINYQKVLLNTFRKLELFLGEDEGESEKIKAKRERLVEIMAMEDAVKRMQEKKPPHSIRILHLSDWHYTGPNADNNMLIRAVKKFKEIDILVITGDLKQVGENYDNTLSILRKLIEELGLEPEDVFMVPGNHDCDDYDRKKEVIADIRKNMFKDKEYYRKYLAELYQGMQTYVSFLEEFYGKGGIEQGGIHNQLYVWKDCLNILSINTALLCDNNSDKDKMVDINELTVLEKKDDLPVLCIAHHKLDQLYLDHEDAVKETFGELKVSAMFSGDIHRSMVNEIYVNPNTIPNYICGKFLGDTNDAWSERNIALYEVNMEKRELTPDLYKLERSRLIPDYTFRERPGNVEDDWKKKPVKLL